MSGPETARRLKVSQARLADLMDGRISKFSFDALVSLSIRAGLNVSLHVSKGDLA